MLCLCVNRILKQNGEVFTREKKNNSEIKNSTKFENNFTKNFEIFTKN